MTYYRSGGHTVYDCRYHVVRITKYRKQRIHEKLKPVLEEILRDIAEELFVKVIRIGMEEDHVHMYLSISLNTWYIPELIQKLKGKSSRILWEDERLGNRFKRFYWKKGVWKRARGYFICTVGEVNDKLIKEYIEEQWKKPPKVAESPQL